MEIKPADVFICGGGIVGSLLACLLAENNISVILYEKNFREIQDIKLTKNLSELRVVAINQISKNILENLQIWQNLEPERLTDFNKIMVWDTLGPAKIEFDSDKLGLNNLGYIIENSHLLKTIYKKIQQNQNIQILTDLAIKKINLDNINNYIEIELDKNIKNIKTKLLVGADGANSFIKKYFKFSEKIFEYKQKAIVANLETEFTHDNRAMQCFLPTGPLAFLPLFKENYCSIVWTNEENLAENIIKLKDLEFSAQLAKNFENKLGKIQNISERKIFSLKMQHVYNYIKPRVVLVGDAAHTAHPLAGQGVNLGILDAAVLAEEILKNNRKNRDIGANSVLELYQNRRLPHNKLMLDMFTRLNLLFGQQNSAVGWLRNLGMSLFNEMGIVKNLISKFAVGYGGDLPEIGRIGKS